MYKELVMMVEDEAYGNEREEFIVWMNENHPEVKLSDGVPGYYEDNELVESSFWDEYCNS
jgi:hypothetical protein